MEKIKKSYQNNKFKLSRWDKDQHGIKNFNYLTDHILFLIFNTIFSISLKHLKDLQTTHHSYYISKIEYRVIYKIKTGYYLELLSRESIKLLESKEKKISRDRNNENAPKLDIILSSTSSL